MVRWFWVVLLLLGSGCFGLLLGCLLGARRLSEALDDAARWRQLCLWKTSDPQRATEAEAILACERARDRLREELAR